MTSKKMPKEMPKEMQEETPENHPYADILHLPHHQSPGRPHMSVLERAAQFSPFAALTGFDDVIAETDRDTASRIELGEYGAYLNLRHGE